MNCADFDRWLDDGSPEPVAHTARAHATSCARCAHAHSAARELESLLADYAPVAPPRFADRVMTRIERVGRTRAQVSALETPVAWWVAALGDPATALAAAVAGLLIWKSQVIGAASLGMALQLGSSVANLRLPALPLSLTQPDVMLGISVALIPATAWLAWVLFRWTEGLVTIRQTP